MLNLSTLKNSFRITLKFNPNDYLQSLTIWKEFRFSEEGEMTTSSSELKWKPGKDLTKKNPSNKGNKREIEQLDYSFFSFFGQEETSDLDPQEMASLLKDELWSEPLKYYRGDVDDEGIPQDEEEEEDEYNYEAGEQENADDGGGQDDDE